LGAGQDMNECFKKPNRIRRCRVQQNRDEGIEDNISTEKRKTSEDP